MCCQGFACHLSNTVGATVTVIAAAVALVIVARCTDRQSILTVKRVIKQR